MRLLAAEADRTGPLSLLIALNDLDADGRDVSWIWDADLEELAPPGRVRTVVVSGRRAADLAVRPEICGHRCARNRRCSANPSACPPPPGDLYKIVIPAKAGIQEPALLGWQG